jgi:hypothetical protein
MTNLTSTSTVPQHSAGLDTSVVVVPSSVVVAPSSAGSATVEDGTAGPTGAAR